MSSCDEISNQLGTAIDSASSLSSKMDSVLSVVSNLDTRLSQIESRLSIIENKLDTANQRFNYIEYLLKTLENIISGLLSRIENIINQGLGKIEKYIDKALVKIDAAIAIINRVLDILQSVFGNNQETKYLTYDDAVRLFEVIGRKIDSSIEIDNRNTSIIFETLQPSIERIDSTLKIAREILYIVRNLRSSKEVAEVKNDLLAILAAIGGVSLAIGGLALALKGIEQAIKQIKINPTININLKGELEAQIKPVLKAVLELNGKMQALKACCDKNGNIDLSKIVSDISLKIDSSRELTISNDNKNTTKITGSIDNSRSITINNDNQNTQELKVSISNSSNQATNYINNITNQSTNAINYSTSQINNSINNSTNQINNSINNSTNQINNNTSTNVTQNIQNTIQSCIEGTKEIEYVTITVPIFDKCEDKEPILTTVSLDIPKGFEVTESLKYQRIAEIESKQCQQETIALVPEWWQIRIEGGIPQFICAFGEVDKDSGKCGHSKYAMTIPHFIDVKPEFCPIPTYKKGNYELIAILKDNSKLIINAFSEYECERVYFAILPWIDKEYSASIKYKVGKRVSYPFKEIWVCPRFGKYFSTGNRDTIPDWTVYF